LCHLTEIRIPRGIGVNLVLHLGLACREAGFGDVVLGPGLQNLLASPILPRGWWNQQLLLRIQEVGGWVSGWVGVSAWGSLGLLCVPCCCFDVTCFLCPPLAGSLGLGCQI
jgi:hypothetical protein